MLSISLGRGRGRFCDGLSRRQMLRLGGTGALSGLSLPGLLELEARAASGREIPAKSVIMIFLEGGPSHIDMWDLKPGAPKEIRGPFHPISTNVPGTRIGNILPRCARVADKFTILRSHSHRDNGHQTGRHWCLTGHKPSFGDGQANSTPFNELYPSIGSMISRELGHGGDGGLKLGLVLLGRAGQQLRCVHGAGRPNDLSHDYSRPLRSAVGPILDLVVGNAHFDALKQT